MAGSGKCGCEFVVMRGYEHPDDAEKHPFTERGWHDAMRSGARSVFVRCGGRGAGLAFQLLDCTGDYGCHEPYEGPRTPAPDHPLAGFRRRKRRRARRRGRR